MRIKKQLEALEAQMQKVSDILKTHQSSTEMLLKLIVHLQEEAVTAGKSADAIAKAVNLNTDRLDKLEDYCFNQAEDAGFPDWESMSRGTTPDDSGTGGVA